MSKTRRKVRPARERGPLTIEVVVLPRQHRQYVNHKETDVHREPDRSPPRMTVSEAVPAAVIGAQLLELAAAHRCGPRGPARPYRRRMLFRDVNGVCVPLPLWTPDGAARVVNNRTMFDARGARIRFGKTYRQLEALWDSMLEEFGDDA